MSTRLWPVEIQDTFTEQQKWEVIARQDRGELFDREPECSCRQTDVDRFDARGCELHDTSSAWNTAIRGVTDGERRIEFTNEDCPF
jgi:hypothetical protein